MNFYGFEVEVAFLVHEGRILAYAWHYDEKKALKHLKRISKFHDLEGEVKRSGKLETWLKERVDDVVLRGKKFKLPDISYRDRSVYERIIGVPRGETATYSQVARELGISYAELLKTLMKNPFQVLIPCHRLVTNRGTLFGFYPLGKEVKKRLLELEKAELSRFCSNKFVESNKY